MIKCNKKQAMTNNAANENAKKYLAVLFRVL